MSEKDEKKAEKARLAAEKKVAKEQEKADKKVEAEARRLPPQSVCLSFVS